MKKNSNLFMIVGVLLVMVVGVSFAYFVSQVLFQGEGSTTTETTADLIKVTYDAGSGSLNATDLYPGKSASKSFTVTVTPGSDTNTATYAIKLNITNNTFAKCDDTNYDSISNACIMNAEELTYTLKDSLGNVIATGDLTGKTGDVVLAKETKTVSATTTYNYTLEITFKDTGADQNHNVNKLIEGSIKVEFTELNAVDMILASKTISTRDDFSVTMTADTTGTIYSAEDDDGTSYYFAGASTDNYVYFAGFYWRIIRINGDGSIRLIYQGTSATSTGTDAQIGTSEFNLSYNNNMYVGYMYTSGSIHGLGDSSTIKGVLDSWYDSNLASYASYIDTNAGFCNDRTPYTSNAGTTSGGGTGTTTTYYGAYIRLYKSYSASNAAPSLKCLDSSDLFTVSASSKGNKALTNPIGLITADEVAYAGGTAGYDNYSYYLYTGQYYWTLSPYYFYYGRAHVWGVGSEGGINYSNVDSSFGVRPVINLKTGILFTTGGEGTASNPYVVLTS